MKSLRFLLLSLAVLVPTFVFAQQTPAPTIRSIEPTTGTIAGGTVVTITGSNLSIPPNFACFAPCPATVTFGGTTVAAREESNERVVVVTPPHAAGPVDVTLKTGDQRSVTVVNGFTFTQQTAESVYERLLLPVYLDEPVAGGQGSLWKTDLWLRNHGTLPVSLAPWPCPADGICLAVFPNTKTLNAGETQHNLNPFFRVPPAIPGRFLYVTKNGAQDVDVNLRISDSSRDTASAGTELPIVREGDWHTSTLHLINVPVDIRFRQTLRIYDTAQTATKFAVRVYDFPSGTELASTTVEVSTPETGEFRDLPPFGQIADLSSLFATNGSRSAVRVEVQPLTAGSRFWAFVSVTNNDTQQVTLVTP